MKRLLNALSNEPPLVKYRGAVLAEITLRKRRQCRQCGVFIEVGERAWFPIVENGRRRIQRHMRYCYSHFKRGDIVA